MGSLPGARSRRRRRPSPPPSHARTVRPSGRERQPLYQVADRPAPGHGPSAPVQRAPPPVLVKCLAPEKGVNTNDEAREGDRDTGRSRIIGGRRARELSSLGTGGTGSCDTGGGQRLREDGRAEATTLVGLATMGESDHGWCRQRRHRWCVAYRWPNGRPDTTQHWHGQSRHG
jgi:hypothetical protein